MKKLLLVLTFLASVSSFANTCLLVVKNINTDEKRLAVMGEDFSVQCDGHSINFTREFAVQESKGLMNDLLYNFGADKSNIKASYQDSNGNLYRVINTNIFH